MKSSDNAAGWYEASLPSRERKRRGHFSTPPLLVERILDACGYLPGADLACIRVLDPACGGGNFLAEAARRLLAYSRLRGLDRAAQIALVKRNLWGFDPDPVACYLAAKNTDLSGYQSTLQRGQADTYLLFLGCVLQVVRPGGWIGLVLPDPVL